MNSDTGPTAAENRPLLSLCMAYKAWEMYGLEGEPLFETELPCGPENKKQAKPEFILPQQWD